MTPKKLKEIRKELGLTQTELATLLGYKMRGLQEWEHGNRPIPELVEKEIYAIYASRTNNIIGDNNIRTSENSTVITGSKNVEFGNVTQGKNSSVYSGVKGMVINKDEKLKAENDILKKEKEHLEEKVSILENQIKEKDERIAKLSNEKDQLFERLMKAYDSKS